MSTSLPSLGCLLQGQLFLLLVNCLRRVGTRGNEREEKGKRGLTSRIESVDIKREVNWLSSSNPRLDLLDDTGGSNSINLSRFNNLKATVSIILIITGPAQSGANTSMDISVIGEQAFLCSVVEVSAMVDAGDFAGRATENFGLPGVEMGVEVDDRDRAVSTVDGTEERESDSVVTTEGDDSREGFAVFCWSLLL